MQAVQGADDHDPVVGVERLDRAERQQQDGKSEQQGGVHVAHGEAPRSSTWRQAKPGPAAAASAILRAGSPGRRA
ncbi:hypothetical protein CATMIT_01743, partial [Catenibacterium mitsuokai DSM 15897]